MRLIRATSLSLGIAALLVGSACGGAGDDGDGPRGTGSDEPATTPHAQEPSAPSTAAVDGRVFVMVGADGFDPVPDSTVRVSFDGQQIGLSPGCNQFGGTYHLDDNGTLAVEGLAGTEMACAQPLMRQDATVTELLMAAPVLALDGDELTLTTPGATMTFRDREVVEPDRALAGPTWRLDTLRDGETATGGMSIDATLRVQREHDRLLVDTGCNTGSADVDVREGELVIGDLVLTRMACEPRVMDVERHIVSVLSATTASFEIESNRLTIDAGRLGLGFVAAA